MLLLLEQQGTVLHRSLKVLKYIAPYLHGIRFNTSLNIAQIFSFTMHASTMEFIKKIIKMKSSFEPKLKSLTAQDDHETMRFLHILCLCIFQVNTMLEHQQKGFGFL